MTQRSSAQLSNQSQDSLLILDLIQQISQSPVDSLGNSVGRPAERCQRKGPKLSGGPRAESCLTSCFGVDMAWSCARLTLEFLHKVLSGADFLVPGPDQNDWNPRPEAVPHC